MYLLSIIRVSVVAALPFSRDFNALSGWNHVSDIAEPMFDRQATTTEDNVTQTNGSYCGEDLAQLNKEIAVELAATGAQLQYLRVAFNSSTQLNAMANLTALDNLVESMASNVALINWSCVSNDLSVQIATVMNDLLVQTEYFLLAVLHHLMEGNKLDQEWPLILGIPTMISQMMEQVSGAVVVFRLTVWREVLNVRTLLGVVAKQQ